jgi:putative heme-binding domain-containing protein
MTPNEHHAVESDFHHVKGSAWIFQAPALNCDKMWRLPMPLIQKTSGSLLGIAALALVSGLPFALAQRGSPSKHPSNSGSLGRNTYNVSCAACHGLDGHGSDKAVNIGAGADAQHFSDAQLSGIIANGVPGTGMPAFRNLSPKQVQAVVLYLRSLQGRTEARTLRGDPKRGKELFFGKGECSTCHTVSGEGGFLGPDLSSYAATAVPTAVRDQIIKAQRTPAFSYRPAVLTTADGERFEGLIRNEDNFSVQFQTKDGSFHFFQKSDLRNLERGETSLMPTDYGDRLSSSEVNDLVSFLVSATPDANKAVPSHKKKEEDDYE